MSPVKHIRFIGFCDDYERETSRLEQVVKYAWNNGLALTVARYLNSEEAFLPKPSIRVTISAKLTKSEMDFATDIIAEAFNIYATS